MEVIALGMQGRVRFGPKLERHPLDLDILTPDGFLERKLREVTKRSDVIGVDLDMEAH